MKAGAAKKRIAIDLEKLLELDRVVREEGVLLDQIRAEQNQKSKLIGKAAPEERAKLAEETKRGKAELKTREEAQATREAELRQMMLRVPNVPASEVPEGRRNVAP